MKKTLLIVMMLTIPALLSAQSISISGFRLLDTDLTAITNGTQEIDQNGEVAALIRVVTSETGFTFDIGALGVVRTKQAVGEIWVYVPKRAQKISIFHQQYGVIRNYYFPIPIESGKTYELKLDVEKKEYSKQTIETLSDDEMAYRSYKAMAVEGDASAQFYTGFCLYKGKGVTQNYVEAVEWFKKAAQQNDARALYYLGVCYENGLGVTELHAEAFYNYNKSAEKNYETAYYDLARCYYYGKGVEQDYLKAYNWCKLGADSDDSNAIAFLGQMYLNGNGVKQNYSQAFKLLNKAAESGNTDALPFLGDCYCWGLGIKRNEKEAVNLYEQAAQKENVYGQYRLAHCYKNGIGIEQNDAQAFNWYQKAAEGKNANACIALGLYYLEGIWVEQNSKEANNWFQKGLVLGGDDVLSKANIKSILQLVIMILKGDDVQDEAKNAISLLNFLISKESPEAMLIMGYCFEKGYGVEQSKNKAESWYNRAIKKAGHNLIEVKELGLKIQ